MNSSGLGNKEIARWLTQQGSVRHPGRWRSFGPTKSRTDSIFGTAVSVGRGARDAELCRSEGDRRVGLSRRQLSSDDMDRHEFAPDSALEGDGFELSVPLHGQAPAGVLNKQP